MSDVRTLEIEIETYQQTIRLLSTRLAEQEARAEFDKAQHKLDFEALENKANETSISCIQALKQLQIAQDNSAEAAMKLGNKTVECRDLRKERDELQRESARHLIIAEYLAKTFRTVKKDTFKVPAPTMTAEDVEISTSSLTFSIQDDFETIIRNIDDLYNVMADFEIQALLKV